MENPLTTARKSKGLTIQRLADLSHLGYQTVLRMEQGLYKNPSPALLAQLRLRGVDVKTLVADYQLYRSAKRSLADSLSSWPPDVPSGTHPFEHWLATSELSQIQFCKDYCVNRAIVHKFIRQYYLCASVPAEIAEALHQAGLGEELLLLGTAYTRFVRSMRMAVA